MEQNRYLVDHKYPRTVSTPASRFTQQQQTNIINLKDYVSIAFKHKYKILIIFILAVLISPAAYYLQSHFIEKIYEAKAIIMIKFGREYITINPNPSAGTPIDVRANDIFVYEKLILDSDELKERIINQLGLERIYPKLVSDSPKDIDPVKAAIYRLGKDMTIKKGQSNLIEIACRHKVPEVAAGIVNLLIEYYQERRMEILGDPKTTFILEKKLAEYRQKLKDSEDNLEAFKETHQIYSLDSELSRLYAQRTELEASVKTAETGAKELEQKLNVLENQLKTVPKQIMPYPVTAESSSPVSIDPVSQLLELRQKEKELLAKYTENNRLVLDIRQEIRLLQELIEKENLDNSTNTIEASQPMGYTTADLTLYQDLEMERITTEATLSSQRVKISELKQQLNEVENEIHKLAAQVKKWRELQNIVALNQKYYEIYVNKLEEARITDDIGRQEMSVQVFQPATVPNRPINTGFDFKIFIALGGLAGIGGGIGLAVLLEFIGQGLSTPKEVEKRLGIPVLATIPYRERTKKAVIR